jgi:hypothetical protein
MIDDDGGATGAVTRLAEAAATGGPVEVIFAVRGTVKPVDGPTGRRWRIRIDRDRVVTFRAEWVVAASPVPPGTPRKR